MKSRKLLLSLAVFFLVGAFVPTKASSLMYSEGEGEDNQPEARGWVSIGPDNVAGRVRAIMFDKYNDGVMYAASVGGGLSVAVNNGANWKEIDFSNGECYAATALAQGDDGAIYVGTGAGDYSDMFSGQNGIARQRSLQSQLRSSKLGCRTCLRRRQVQLHQYQQRIDSHFGNSTNQV